MLPLIPPVSIRIITVFLLCILSFTLASEYAQNSFGISIDAGSSGTRCYLYTWDPREVRSPSDSPPFSRPITQAGWRLKSIRRLTDYAEQPHQVYELFDEFNPYVIDLLKSLGAPVDKPALAKIPVFLGATAGMRLLPVEQRSDLMEATRDYFTTSPYQFEDHYARVLSGDEEAVFAYIATNYLFNTLLQSTPSISTSDAAIVSSKQVYGALDMGGASTQMVFAPYEDIMENYFEYSAPGNVRHHLYAVSFLTFGLNQAYYNLNDALISTNINDHQDDILTDDDIRIHPCLNVGVTYPYKHRQTGQEVQFQGKPDLAQCDELVAQLFHLDTRCLTDNCTINGVYIPSIPETMKLVAHSGFASVILSFTDEKGPLFTPSQVTAIRDRVCELTSEQLSIMYPSVPREYRDMICFSLSYINSLLLHAYRFPADTPLLYVSDTIDDIEISWALGRMVYEVNLLTYDHLNSSPKTSTLLIGFAVGLAVMVFLLLWVICRQQDELSGHRRLNAFQEFHYQQHDLTPSSSGL